MSHSNNYYSKQIQALNNYLADYLEEERRQNQPNPARLGARDKLTKLTQTQFDELSTDVYDEMLRRQEVEQEQRMMVGSGNGGGNVLPFLAVQPAFHPKRNQARQKLATLSVQRFKDLASDVYRELERRFPQTGTSNQDLAEDNDVVEAVIKPQPIVVRKVSNSNHSVPRVPLQPSRSRETLNNSAGNNQHQATLKESSSDLDLNQQQQQQKYERSGSQLSSFNSAGAPLSVLAKSNSFSTLHNNSSSAKPPQQSSPQSKPSNNSNNAQGDHQTNISGVEEAMNFQSLENLMADLGSMLTTQFDDASITSAHSPSQSAAPAPNNVNTRKQPEPSQQQPPHVTNSFKQSSVRDQANSPIPSGPAAANPAIVNVELKHLREEKKELTDKLDRVRSELFQLQAQHQRTRQDYENLQNENEKMYRGHQEQVQSLQGEIKTLRAKLEDMSARNSEHESARQSLMDESKALKSRNHELTSLLEQERQHAQSAQAEINKLKSEIESLRAHQSSASNAAADNMRRRSSARPANAGNVQMDILSRINPNSESQTSESGYVNRKHLEDYKQALQELFRALISGNDSPASVLIAMKAIVIGTRGVSDALDRYEEHLQSMGSQGDSIKHQVGSIKNEVNMNLTALMNAAKTFATGQKSNVDDIYQNVSLLTNSVVNVVDMLKISRPLDLKQLKVHLDSQTDRIVQNIQELLQAMKTSSFGPSFKQTVSNITSVVDNLIHVAKSSLANSSAAGIKMQADPVVQNLSESNGRLGEMGEAMSGEKKPSKQKLAGGAYEVAKFTKELVSLLDSDQQ